MRALSPANLGGFFPGQCVKVIDGTFAGEFGEVITHEQALSLWQEVGGQEPVLTKATGMVWVVVPVFGRKVPVNFLPCQLEPH
jgi:transcription antitermination factor NusG